MTSDDQRSETEERLARYLAGEMRDEELEAFEGEIVARPELARRLYDEMNVRGALDEAAKARASAGAEVAGAPGESGGEETRRRDAGGDEPARDAPAPGRFAWLTRRRVLPPLAAAALLTIVVVTVVDRGPGDDPTFRGPVAPSTPLVPEGAQAEPPRTFTWTSDPGAATYRFALFDGTSRPVHAAVVAETTLTLGPEVEVPALGYWEVTPLDEIHVAGDASAPSWYHVE